MTICQLIQEQIAQYDRSIEALQKTIDNEYKMLDSYFKPKNIEHMTSGRLITAAATVEEHQHRIDQFKAMTSALINLQAQLGAFQHTEITR